MSACELHGARRPASGCVLRETCLVAGGTGTQLRVLGEKKTHPFLYFADYWISLCKCGVKGPCYPLEVLKCLVSCLGFLWDKESKRIVSVQKVWSCHVSWLDNWFCLAVVFISVGVLPTGSKVPLTEPVLNAATHKLNSCKHLLFKCIFIICKI